MSASANPFGLRPIKHPSGNARATCYFNGIASAYGTAIYQYSPVILNTNGTMTIGTTAADIIGSFDGLEYVDSNGRMQFSKMWPASLAPLSGSSWQVYVWDDPVTQFEMQCNGSLAATAVGDQADFVNPGNGSNTTQLSSAAISSTLAGNGAQAQLRILEKSPYVDNDWGDAFTIVTVQIARHQYVSNKVAI